MKKRMMGNSRGQVAILFALVFTFMFVLFAFVVDFGHLIQNKINLQMAADTAAYAGASWQARVLNRIGQLNYRMRQDIKEFTMRSQVTHSRHNRNFPRGVDTALGDRARAEYEMFICQQAHGYQAISGLRYQPDTNLCRNASPSVGGLPPIIVPPIIAKFDPFAIAIVNQIRRIQQAANQECRAAAEDNRILVDYLINTYTRRSQFHAEQVQQLASYLNSIASDRGPLGIDSQPNHEAVQTALQSAVRNLTFSNNDSFQMQVLQPEGGQYLSLDEYKLRASLFYFDFNVIGNGCVARPAFRDFNDMIAGYAKLPEVVTYFSVKLSSKPRLFFMPQRWVESAFPELVAISTAKPFGSRIGPELRNTDILLPLPNRPQNQNRLLNFSFFPNDTLGLMNTKIIAFLDLLHPYNSMGRPEGNRQRGWPAPQANSPGRDALQAIRAPTVFDAAFYTVFPDPGSEASKDYLEPQFAMALYPDYLEAADHRTDTILETPVPRTPAYFPTEVGSRNRGPGWIQIQANNTEVGGPYQGYVEESISSHSVTTALGLPLLDNSNRVADFGFATAEMLHSAWSPQSKAGRIGYGVKFVGLDFLTRSLQIRQGATGTLGPIANPPTGDPNIFEALH